MPNLNVQWFVVWLACFYTTFDVMCAVVVADPESLSIPGVANYGGFTKIRVLNDDAYALLSNRGVIEVDSNFYQLRAYKFDHNYRWDREFVEIDGELHIVGQIADYRVIYQRNDIHLLRYDESAPIRTWKCRHTCMHPRIVNFFDYENPTLIWKDLKRRRQSVHIVQLGTEREWRLDSSGFVPYIRRIGSWDESKGLQDVHIDLKAYLPRFPRNPILVGVKTVRLSDLNLLEGSPKHLNEYAGLPYGQHFESPSPGYQAEGPHHGQAEIPRSHFYGDPKAREARIGIHTEAESTSTHDDSDHLWWKVKTQYGIKGHYRTYRSSTLDCRSSSGEPFDSYLMITIGGLCWSQCGSTIYELRPGGFWREVYHTPVNQHALTFDRNKKDHFHIIFTGRVVRLDRGVDYCVEDLDQFQPSLP